MWDEELAYKNTDPEDLWIYDKLILSTKLGYKCGPKGISVPEAGHYIVRPCVNIMGMGEGASIEYLEDSTDHLPSGTFWCEVFTGPHYSFDFIDGELRLAVLGVKEEGSVKNFKYWLRDDHQSEAYIPEVIQEIVEKHKYVNVERIGLNVIEVHLRRNPDFYGHNSDIVIPVLKDEPRLVISGMKFIEAKDGNRVGFYIKE